MSRRAGRLASVLVLVAVQCSSAHAAPVPCGAGSIDIQATSDTPITPPTFNVGQKTVLTAIAAGITPTAYAWTVPGPIIKDYNDYLGTMEATPPATPLPWSTTAVAAADLATSSLSFYWKPSPAQTHPNAGPPEARNVLLTVTLSGGITCTASATFMIERNLTDVNKQPEDFYTSTHRAPTTTNQGLGRVIEEHMFWHQHVGGGAAGSWLQFLAWHAYFLRRFDEWRVEFGYPPVAPWYPGRPLPTGPQFDNAASLRQPSFDPDSNRVPTYYTIAGGTALNSGARRLSEFTTLDQFSDSFEFSYHGQVHCNIGTSGPGAFFATSGPFFGSMCVASSPKDPMFWRWHGFIDLMYRNYCQLKGITCHSPNAPTADPWMADNAADVAAVGAVPSPGPHWLSPDVWNRRSQVATDGCIPRAPPPFLNTVGGVQRDCGTDADHENPVAGTTNFLYGTIRDTRSGSPRTVYAEVAVYIANASTGLAWPTDFTMLPETRQFITLHLEPGTTTAIGPIPWTPPSPTPSDHFCLYLRVLTAQETPPVEGSNVDTNVANSNSIAWRNLKVVTTAERRRISRFIVRNVGEQRDRIALRFEVTPELFKVVEPRITLDARLQRALAAGKSEMEGIRLVEGGTYVLTAPKATLTGFMLAPKGTGAAMLDLSRQRGDAVPGEVVVTQLSGRGAVQGGVVLRVAKSDRSTHVDRQPR